MTDGSSKGLLFSATLHGIAAALLLLSFVMKTRDPDAPKVFELVAGEGDNYMAREAPALGSADGVKFDVPKMPEPKPAPPKPEPQETVTPVQPAPAPPPIPKVVTPTPPKQADPAVPDFRKKLRSDVIRAESQAKRDIKKKREAEARKAAEEKKRIADEQKTLTKEEFDRLNKTKGTKAPAKSSPTKIAKIDAEGIAKGVVGGSTANKVGGAGGKALKVENDDVLAAYDALFKQRLRTEFEPPPGLSDSLKAEVEVRSNADGTLTGGRIAKSSGSEEFDRAVLDALRRVRMPARPDRKGEVIAFTFTMRERLER
jgi:colicin import membrane protein